MKNVCLLTCFINNYGACLQAYALQQTILESGSSCDIAKYVEPKSYDKNRGLTLLYKNDFTRFLLRILSKQYRIQYQSRKKFNEFKEKYLKFTDDEFLSGDELEKISNVYDIFVCGSDQIWNPTFCGEYFKAYMLGFVHGKKKVAYAPSVGVSEIKEEYFEKYETYLKDFSLITCREKTGASLIKNNFGYDARDVLDPTLLLERTKWIEMCHKSKLSEEEYIFVYAFDDRDFYHNIITDYAEYAKCKVYIIPFTENQRRWGFTNIYDAGPLDFVALIHNAKLVITDSFHATAFSINLNTPFISLERNLKNGKINMSSRITDLLSLTELESRMINDDAYSFDFSILSCSFENSNEKLCEQRKKDKKLLYEALENTEK